jgi:heme A synthase
MIAPTDIVTNRAVWWRGALASDLRRRLWIIFGLGGLQGAVGWWMGAAVNGAFWLAAIIILQATVGILTLLNAAPIVLALTHQGVAIVVLTLAVLQAERLLMRRSEKRSQKLTYPAALFG